MDSERILEGVEALAEELPIRVLLSKTCEDLAELSAILAAFKDLPPELFTRLRAIEEEFREINRFCQAPPVLTALTLSTAASQHNAQPHLLGQGQPSQLAHPSRNLRGS